MAESPGELGWSLLAARASEAEAGFAFAGLIDLLDGVGEEVLSCLPAPQLAALEAALLHAEPAGAALEPTAIGLGVALSPYAVSSVSGGRGCGAGALV